jgi:prephenate dehydrogenase
MNEPGVKLQHCRVAIVGLGLMGGSLALALRGRCAALIGVDIDPATLALARAQGVVDETVVFGPALGRADLVVLATPVRTLLDQLASLPPPSSRGQVLIDLGSTKAAVTRAMAALPEGWQPLGGHPMCGKETGGLANAEAGLYRGRTFVLCPLERTSPQALALACELAEAAGAEPLVMDPARHDALAALVSHLPYTAAAALMQAVLAEGDPAAWQMAASGFRDTTRLAASDLTMMTDILLTNREAVLAALSAYRGQLDQLTAAIDSADPAALRAALEPAQKRRSQLFK